MAEDTSPLAEDAKDLEQRYGANLLDHPPLVSDERFRSRLAERDALDPHFARVSLEFASGTLRRGGLERSLRYLVQIGMFTVSKSHGHLEDALRSAMREGVSTRHLLEVIFLTHIYGGDTVMDPAVGIFSKIAAEEGVLDQLRENRLPVDRSDRDYASEQENWSEEFRNDPRLERLIDEFGWQGVSTGFKYRGVYHLDALEYLEKLDLSWGRLWESMAYEGMYSRGYLDDKTRLLCTVGDCIALGATGTVPTREHMREALHFGNSPQEILEVLYMAGLHLGFPIYIDCRKMFVQIMADEGRLSEIGDVTPPKPIDAR